MNEQEFFEYLDNDEDFILGDILVLIKVDLTHEPYNIIEYLSLNYEDNKWYWEWEHDWYEGEEYQIIGWMYPDEVPEDMFTRLEVHKDVL